MPVCRRSRPGARRGNTLYIAHANAFDSGVQTIAAQTIASELSAARIRFTLNGDSMALDRICSADLVY